MLIDFESSGGYANLQLSYHANTDTLPPEIAAEISKLVASSGVFDISQEDVAPSPSGPPDVLSYRLSLRDGARQTTLTLNDVTAPPSLHPLLALLRKLAVEERLKRQ
jgi:hypothetical protein